MKFDRDNPLYVSILRRTICDASGNFFSPRVPGGVWCVTAAVKRGGPGDRAERLDDEVGGRARREAGEGDVALGVEL